MTINTSFILIPSKKYYLPFDFYEFNDVYLNILKDILDKKTWYIVRDRIFISCMPKGSSIPDFGWKIHISGTIWDSKEILSIVCNFCYENNIAFKCLMDGEVFDLSQNKSAPRGNSGKFITIYPQDEEQFKKITPLLYKKLKQFNGPFILTDRRYRKKGIVYYRYGALSAKSEIIDDKEVHVIKESNGRTFIDDRRPAFQLPHWIQDPFHIETDLSTNEILLNGQYKIIKALRFSNAGGTYLAENILGEKVILKEARPFTVQHGKQQDSINLKENELKILEKIQHLKLSPLAIDFFYEWEHAFLVESYIEGRTLKQFIVSESPFATPNSSNENFNDYYKRVTEIMAQLLENIKLIHKSNVIVGDISPENIIIDENYKPTFVDFDGSTDIDSASEQYIFTTLGFDSKLDDPNNFNRDYVSLGYLLFYLLTPSSNILELKKDFYIGFLRHLETSYKLPKEFRTLMSKLVDINIEHDIDEYLKLLRKVDPKIHLNPSNNILTETLESDIQAVGKFILDSKLNDESQMFPSDFLAKESLSIMHGTAGILRALDYGNIPYEPSIFEEFKQKLFSNLNETELGLDSGLSGICWYFLEKDLDDEAKFLLNEIVIRKKSVKNFNLGSGLSGIGMILLKAFLKYKDLNYLNSALQIGEQILNSVDVRNIDKIGLNNGRAGLSLYLLYLSSVSGEKKFAKFGREILLDEIGNSHEVNSSYGFPSSTKKQKIIYPYFSEGNAGVAAVAIRYQYASQDDTLNKEIIKLANGLNCVLSTDMGFYAGLAGIANTLLDFYYFTSDQKYYVKAKEIFTNIQCFLLKQETGKLAFPGSLMYRFSCDYATGASGFIMLSERLKSNNKNFHFFLDDVLEKNVLM